MSNKAQSRLSSDDSVPIVVEHRGVGTSRPTIAVLMDYMTQFVGSYEAQFRDAFHLKCRERDLNLLLVYGGVVDNAYFGSRSSVGLFDLIRTAAIDGCVLMAPVIASSSRPLARFRVVVSDLRSQAFQASWWTIALRRRTRFLRGDKLHCRGHGSRDDEPVRHVLEHHDGGRHVGTFQSIHSCR